MLIPTGVDPFVRICALPLDILIAALPAGVTVKIWDSSDPSAPVHSTACALIADGMWSFELDMTLYSAGMHLIYSIVYESGTKYLWLPFEDDVVSASGPSTVNEILALLASLPDSLVDEADRIIAACRV